jgi:hypothetical protein
MKKIFTAIPITFLVCFITGCQQGKEASKETVVEIDAKKEALLTLREVHCLWPQHAS